LEELPTVDADRPEATTALILELRASMPTSDERASGNSKPTSDRQKLRLPHVPSGPIMPPPIQPGQGSVLPPGRSAVAPQHIDSAPTAPAPRRGGNPLPVSWTIVMVLDRLEEAFEVLARLPMTVKPRGFANSMPKYAYDRSDLIAQIETGELDRLMRQQNQVRFNATSAEVTRMEAALYWPMLYLRDNPEVAMAVQLGALWAASRQNAKARLKALKINGRAFNRRKMHGLLIIATALVKARVPVS
jgi:hypothetical protein